MRKVIGWLLMTVGVVSLLLTGAVAAIFGPDDTVLTGPHQLTSAGSAIVAAPSAPSLSGPTLVLTASTNRPRAELFIGVAHDVDVRNYLARTTYTRIESVSLPWSVQEAHILAGSTRHGSPLVDPAQQPWWLSRNTGAAGTADVSANVPLPDSPIDVVLMDLRHLRGFTVDVTVGVEQPGIFLGALAGALAGAGLVCAGWVLRRQP